MSITWMEPLDGEEVVEASVKVAGDAHHFTDDEIRAAAAILRSLDSAAVGQQLYQLSAIPELRVIFDLALDFVMGVGPNITASVIYDAAKSLFRRGTTNTFDIAFKESRRGTRSLKVAIKVSTDEELKIALDRLPQVLESGAGGRSLTTARGMSASTARPLRRSTRRTGPSRSRALSKRRALTRRRPGRR